jgi:DNA-binding CsgD family transcriptional regulator
LIPPKLKLSGESGNVPKGTLTVVQMQQSQLDIHALTGRLITRLKGDGFCVAVDKELRAIVPFDLTALLAFPMGRKPTLLHDGLNGVSPPHVMETYLNGTYVLDACYVACTQGLANGLYRLSDVAPDEFFSTNYYTSPDVHPCISLESGTLAEEIFYLSQPEPGLFYCYSLMRSSSHHAFTDEEFRALQAISPIVNSLLGKHFEGSVPAALPALTSNLDEAFSSFESDHLSAREQHIVSLVLRGHSSGSAAQALDIAEGTVKNHRKHIYAKLGISSQGELFNLFLSHIMAK